MRHSREILPQLRGDRGAHRGERGASGLAAGTAISSELAATVVARQSPTPVSSEHASGIGSQRQTHEADRPVAPRANDDDARTAAREAILPARRR